MSDLENVEISAARLRALLVNKGTQSFGEQHVTHRNSLVKHVLMQYGNGGFS